MLTLVLYRLTQPVGTWSQSVEILPSALGFLMAQPVEGIPQPVEGLSCFCHVSKFNRLSFFHNKLNMAIRGNHFMNQPTGTLPTTSPRRFLGQI